MFEIEFTPEDTLDQRNKTIKDLLRENHCEITFTKVDGSQRVMPCTLREGSYPLVESKGTKKANPEVMSVFCTDKQEWRSFKIMNVTQLKIIE